MIQNLPVATEVADYLQQLQQYILTDFIFLRSSAALEMFDMRTNTLQESVSSFREGFTLPDTFRASMDNEPAPVNDPDGLC